MAAAYDCGTPWTFLLTFEDNPTGIYVFCRLFTINRLGTVRSVSTERFTDLISDWFKHEYFGSHVLIVRFV